MDLNKFSNVALHFSGGKDSLALLYMLKPWLDRITVYSLDTGDRPPETQAVIDEVKAWIPKFVEVRADSKAWRKANGICSDLVPAHSELLGVLYGMSELRLSSRFQCCSANLMLPMHLAMVEDGVDLVIRGTKLTDTGKVPFEGKSPYYEVWLPLKLWTHEMVFSYLVEQGAPQNPIYQYSTGSSPECLTCTAWWDDGKAKFLKACHPKEYREYRVSLTAIRTALQRSLDELDSELGEA